MHYRNHYSLSKTRPYPYFHYDFSTKRFRMRLAQGLRPGAQNVGRGLHGVNFAKISLHPLVSWMASHALLILILQVSLQYPFKCYIFCAIRALSRLRLGVFPLGHRGEVASRPKSNVSGATSGRNPFCHMFYSLVKSGLLSGKI